MQWKNWFDPILLRDYATPLWLQRALLKKKKHFQRVIGVRQLNSFRHTQTICRFRRGENKSYGWERDENNQGKQKESWLVSDRPVFPEALSAWLFFLDLSFFWHLLFLLSVSGSADGLRAVLRQQLRVYQVGKCMQKKKGERQRQIEKEREGGW